MHTFLCLALLAAVIPSGETLTVTSATNLDFTFIPDDDPVVVDAGVAFDVTLNYDTSLQPFRLGHPGRLSAFYDVSSGVNVVGTVNITHPGNYIFWNDGNASSTEYALVAVNPPGPVDVWITIVDVATVPTIHVDTGSGPVPNGDIVLPMFGDICFYFDTSTSPVTSPDFLINGTDTILFSYDVMLTVECIEDVDEYDYVGNYILDDDGTPTVGSGGLIYYATTPSPTTSAPTTDSPTTSAPITSAPTNTPTDAPTVSPIGAPTMSPTAAPTAAPEPTHDGLTVGDAVEISTLTSMIVLIVVAPCVLLVCAYFYARPMRKKMQHEL